MDRERVRPTERRACSWQGITGRVLAPAFQRPVSSRGVYGPDARGVIYFRDKQRLAGCWRLSWGPLTSAHLYSEEHHEWHRFVLISEAQGSPELDAESRSDGSTALLIRDIWVMHAPSDVLTLSLGSVCVVCMSVCLF